MAANLIPTFDLNPIIRTCIYITWPKQINLETLRHGAGLSRSSWCRMFHQMHWHHDSVKSLTFILVLDWDHNGVIRDEPRCMMGRGANPKGSSMEKVLFVYFRNKSKCYYCVPSNKNKFLIWLIRLKLRTLKTLKKVRNGTDESVCGQILVLWERALHHYEQTKC